MTFKPEKRTCETCGKTFLATHWKRFHCDVCRPPKRKAAKRPLRIVPTSYGAVAGDLVASTPIPPALPAGRDLSALLALAVAEIELAGVFARLCQNARARDAAIRAETVLLNLHEEAGSGALAVELAGKDDLV